jgi:hypothetical protein
MAETLSEAIGNANAVHTVVDLHRPDSVIAYLAVRWDGDKILGLKWTYLDGQEMSAGNADKVGNTLLTSYNFAPGEYLLSLQLHDSGYGYGSFRQLLFTTTIPGTPPQQGSFAAGPRGFDNEVSPLVHGRYLTGFKVGVNVDQFINTCAVYTIDKYPS